MSLKEVKVPEGYTCALCSKNRMNSFVDSKIFEHPICILCNAAIYMSVEADVPEHDRTAVAVKEVTGRAWPECRMLWYEDELEYWEEKRNEQSSEFIASLSSDLGMSVDEAWGHVDTQIEKNRAALEEERNKSGAGGAV